MEPDWLENIAGTIEGVCHFWSETGSEGGHWAIQDRMYIAKAKPTYGVWDGTTVYDAADEGRSGIVHKVSKADGRPLPAPDSSYGISRDELVVAEVEWEEGVFETRPSDSLLTMMWDYKGLRVLRDGDHLTIFEADGERVEWAGVIDLIPYPDLSEEVNGVWVRSDQVGVEREQWAQWFFEERPARLRPLVLSAPG